MYPRNYTQPYYTFNFNNKYNLHGLIKYSFSAIVIFLQYNYV